MNTQFEVDFTKSDQTHELAQQIACVLQDIQFGSIEIVVHDGRIVQIDKHEKFRIKNTAAAH